MERLTKTYSDGTHGAADNLPCGENSYEYKGLLLEALGKYEDLEEQGRLLRLPVKKGDIVWELCECDDGVFRIFPMEVKVVAAFGELLRTSSRCCTWNIYAESDYTKMYKSFYDIGTSVFLTEEKAREKLKEMETT
nr:MAG TPA: hypothetical protein [Caudoviricetes sp.]